MARVRVVRSCIIVFIVIIIVVTTTIFTTAISTTMICGGFAHDTHNCGDSHRQKVPRRQPDVCPPQSTLPVSAVAAGAWACRG